MEVGVDKCILLTEFKKQNHVYSEQFWVLTLICTIINVNLEIGERIETVIIEG